MGLSTLHYHSGFQSLFLEDQQINVTIQMWGATGVRLIRRPCNSESFDRNERQYLAIIMEKDIAFMLSIRTLCVNLRIALLKMHPAHENEERNEFYK